MSHGRIVAGLFLLALVATYVVGRQLPDPTPAPAPSARDSLLTTLVLRCTETDDQLVAMAAKATQMMEADSGRRFTTTEVLRQLADATKGMSDVQCSGVLAPVMVLMVKGAP